MEWVIAAAAIVQAIAAAIIVRFTRVSLDKSEKMAIAAAKQVEATQEQIRQSALPVLTIDVVDFVHGDGDDPRDGFRIRVANVGLGPALEVEITLAPQRGENLLSVHRTWAGSTIEAGDRIEVADIKMDASLIQLSVIYQQQVASDIEQVTVTYSDVYNRHGTLEGAVEFAHQVPPGNNHARFVQKTSQLPGAKSEVKPHNLQPSLSETESEQPAPLPTAIS
jgi:hypothetical protein